MSSLIFKLNLFLPRYIANTIMTTLEIEQESQSQSSLLFLDCLYCQEKCWDDDDFDDDDVNGDNDSSSLEDDEDDQLVVLLSKEETMCFSENELEASKSLLGGRKEALDWMIRVNAHHSFSAITLVLAVNYFDRFFMKFGYQQDTPWLIQLIALASLSLASKIEETHVPPLLDFQVECKYKFEAKMIQRMELLVLSTLEWKMNAVTPFSYFGHLLKMLKLKTHLHWEILCRCETLLLSAIVDPAFLCHVPSVLAVATIALALKELGLWSLNPFEHQIHLMDTFKLCKDKVEECYKFIQELSSNNKTHKRKSINGANSPQNVLESVSMLSSSEPLPKRNRTLETHCLG